MLVILVVRHREANLVQARRPIEHLSGVGIQRPGARYFFKAVRGGTRYPFCLRTVGAETRTDGAHGLRTDVALGKSPDQIV